MEEVGLDALGRPYRIIEQVTIEEDDGSSCELTIVEPVDDPRWDALKERLHRRKSSSR